MMNKLWAPMFITLGCLLTVVPTYADQLQTCTRTSDLPASVQRMYKSLYKAARSGDLGYFKEVFEMNELPPAFGDKRINDPVAYLKSISSDGSGADILAKLSLLLETKCVMKPNGRNNTLYIWPVWAEKGLEDLKPFERIALFRLTPNTAQKMISAGKYTGPSLGIGEDGTWHFWLNISANP